MLQTQVNYWTLEENKRHNVETERLGFETLEETKRHNRVTESQTDRQIDLGFANLQLGRDSLEEQKRHSRVTEAQGQISLDLGYFNAYENRRANMARESIQREQNAIAWSNAGEIIRHNQAQESISQTANRVQQRNARTREKELQFEKNKFDTTYDKEYQIKLRQAEQKDRELDIAEQRMYTGQADVFGNLLTHSSIQYTSPYTGQFTSPMLPGR